MTMYKCGKCGEVFSEEEFPYTEDACPTDRGTQILHIIDECCPHCDSHNIREIYACPVCGEWESDFDGDMCENCKEEVIYWTAEAMVNVMAWLNIKDPLQVIDYIEDAMWDLTHKDEDKEYLAKVIAERKEKNGNNKR